MERHAFLGRFGGRGSVPAAAKGREKPFARTPEHLGGNTTPRLCRGIHLCTHPHDWKLCRTGRILMPLLGGITAGKV